MHCILYRFEIHPDKEEQFNAAWDEITRGYLAHCGALGSRLHRVDRTTFIAYAQWPDKQVGKLAALPPDYEEC